MGKKSKKKTHNTYDYYETETNPYLKQLIIDVVNNQIRDNNPPIARITYERLKADGYTTQEAKEKIASVLVVDIYEVLKNNTPHNEAEYERQLSELK